MKTNKTIASLCFLALAALLVIAWNPASTSFNTNQFLAVSPDISIKSGVLLTNPSLAGTISGNVTGTGGIVLSNNSTINNVTLTGTATAGTLNATAANLQNVVGLADGLTNSSGYHFADTNALVAGDTASTNYTVTATNTLAGYIRTVTAGTTNYVIDATNTSAGYARTLTSQATNEVTRQFTLLPSFSGQGAANVGFGTAAKYTSPWGTTVTGGAATEANVSMPIPQACHIQRLYLRSNMGTSTNLLVTLVTNGVASNLQVSMNGTGSFQTASDTTHSVAVSAGDLVSFSWLGNNPTAPSGSIISVYAFQVVP